MAFYPDERIAIFIDGSNLYSTVKNLDFDIDYKKMLDLFRGKGRLIRANYYTALVEEADYSPIRPLVDWLDYNGYHCITKPAKSQVDRDGRRHTKGNMDAEMIVDMLELAPHIDHMILYTGDGDFKAPVAAVQQRVHRPRGGDLAVLQDGHAIAEHLDVAQDEAGEDERLAAGALLEEQVTHLLAADGVEAAHGLVEHQELGVMQQRLREPDPLHHALAELPDGAVDGVGEADLCEEGLGAAGAGVFVHPDHVRHNNARQSSAKHDGKE